MNNTERPMPPLDADERSVLEGWLDFHRATLARKCEGLDDTQAATATVAPSELTLTGLVQHMAEVERTWFRRILAAEELATTHTEQARTDGTDGGFELAEHATLHDALNTWRTEVEHARRSCREHSLTDTGDLGGQHVNLRWIYVHMIEEYARHNGHADLLRERLDGTTGI